MNAPGARQALYYETICTEYRACTRGRETARRVPLTSREGLFEWLCSDELAAAVQDGGSNWFGG